MTRFRFSAVLSLVLAPVAAISLIGINELGFQRASTAVSGITPERVT
jgi:hypothetical protein